MIGVFLLLLLLLMNRLDLQWVFWFLLETLDLLLLKQLEYGIGISIRRESLDLSGCSISNMALFVFVTKHSLMMLEYLRW
jgi:hypothetical protein